jgi:zinc transport system substrate-binding protein
MMAFFQSLQNLKSAAVLAVLLLLPGMVICGASLGVWVTIEPQAYFVESVGGEAVEVRVLVRPGHCVELYSPSPRDMAALSQAAAYFRIGVPVEAVITARLEAREKKLRFYGRVFEGQEHTHGHAHCEICGDADSDPHIWLDPLQMIDYVDVIEAGLSELLPERAADFKANAGRLRLKLEQLHASLKARFDKHSGRTFYINHPSLLHFAERYGLEQRAIEHAGSAPAAKRMATLIKEARATKAGAVLTQPEFGRSSAAVMADALGVPMREVNILGRDYFSNMRSLADALEGSFEND